MNIDDTKFEGEIPEKIFKAIFDHQKDLMVKYDKIESRNGMVIPEKPYNLDDRKVQYRLKDLFWRATEEIAEACENTPATVDWRMRFENDSNLRHFFEELADAVHFLVEATIIADYPAVLVESIEWEGSLIEEPDEIEFQLWKVIKSMGLCANMLKNKPWKNTEMSTDILRFRRQIGSTWLAMIDALSGLGLEPKDIYVLYIRKNQVNHFRQRSNY